MDNCGGLLIQSSFEVPGIHPICQTDLHDFGAGQPNHQLIEVDLHPLDNYLVLHPHGVGQLVGPSLACSRHARSHREDHSSRGPVGNVAGIDPSQLRDPIPRLFQEFGDTDVRPARILHGGDDFRQHDRAADRRPIGSGVDSSPDTQMFVHSHHCISCPRGHGLVLSKPIEALGRLFITTSGSGILESDVPPE